MNIEKYAINYPRIKRKNKYEFLGDIVGVVVLTIGGYIILIELASL